MIFGIAARLSRDRRAGGRGVYRLDVVSTARLSSCCDTIRYSDEGAEKTGRMPARHMAGHQAKKLGKISRATSLYEHRNSEISLRILATSMPRLTTRTRPRRIRYARYKSSTVTANTEEARLTRHDDVSRRENQAMARFPRKVEARHRAGAAVIDDR